MFIGLTIGQDVDKRKWGRAVRVSNVTVRKRLLLLFVVGIVVFTVIGARLGYVQFGQGLWLTEKAEDSWGRDIPFEPKRGDILDRNDVELATNISTPSIIIFPRQIKDPADAAEKLASVLNANKDEVYEDLTKKESKVYIRPEGQKMDQQTVQEVRSLNIEGIYIAEDSKRHYPFGSYLSHVLGFAGIDNQGLTGLEFVYDEKLKGTEGYVSFYSTAKNTKMPNLADEYTAPINGLNLKLTIDSRVQTIVERELDIAEAKYNPDGAIAIAMNPKNGEILAMSSRPHFNPENYRDVPAEIYNQNKPVWMQYEPGSTFKLITLAAALEEDVVDLDNDHFYDPGYVDVAGTKLHCWKRGGHGSQTFLEVVQNSCNPGFVELGQRLGTDRLFDYIEDFGFGQKTGVDLQGEAKGILFNRERVGPLEQATTAFGQGVAVTPIQQVAAVAAAVNGGYLYEPYIAKEWVDDVTGEVVERNNPVMKRQVISPETSEKVRYAMENVVAKGSGGKAFVDGYRVGGKTGTAQKAKDGRYLENNYILSFLGVAPMDDPEIIVYVAIDNAKGAVQYGSQVSAPIAGKIIGDSLEAMGVEKRKDQIEKELKWDEEGLVEVPNLLGRTKRDIYESHYELRLSASGEGEAVARQAPEPGTRVPKDSTIRVYMGDKTNEND